MDLHQQIRGEQSEEEQEVALQKQLEQVVKSQFLEGEQELTGVDQGVKMRYKMQIRYYATNRYESN